MQKQMRTGKRMAGRSVTSWKGIAAGMFTVTVPVLIGLMNAAVVRSQTLTTTRLEFEVATIKPNRSGDGFDVRSIGKEPGKVVLQNVSLKDCIEAAVGVNGDQIAGPGWLDTDKFNILAQAPAGTSKDRLRMMLQTLLEDRFKLKTHREKRAGSVYALVVGKTGPKLKPASGGANRLVFGPPGHLTAQNVTMSMLAEALAGKMGRPVLDSTSLSGFFDFALDFAPDDRPNDNAPSMPTAVQEQLGLRLEPTKGTVEVLVVDHADRVPIEN